MDLNISFEWSPFLLIPALTIGVFLSYFLYRKDEKFPLTLRRVLFALRFLIFTLLFILLLNPVIKHFKNTVEKPSFVLALDNSTSVARALGDAEIEKLKEEIRILKNEAESRDINFEILTLDSEEPVFPENISFESKRTNISGLLGNIEKRYENRNLSGILLLSDGLFNRGMSPLYSGFSERISTYGLGDTTEVRDVWINEINYNEVAFINNFFPVQVGIQQNGFDGESVVVRVIRDKAVIESKSLTFNSGEKLKNADFNILAKEKGQHRLVIQVLAENEDEKLRSNNSRDIYLEIIDGRDKVLIAAMGPHPDIKALKSALNTSSNYEVDTYFAGRDEIPDKKYDLVIFHQIPNIRNSGNALVPLFREKKIPMWYILGPGSDYLELNREFKGVLLKSQVRQTDDVNPILNQEFDKFTFPEGSDELMPKLPPMKVPFANYELGEGANIVLYQGVGRINSGKPLLALQQSSGNKYAFLAGDDLWAWRMYEYAENENFEFTNALVNKTVQFLSLKEDKRKFRIRLKDQRNLFEGMPVVFQTEVYNDIYEPIYGKEISMVLINEEGEKTDYSYFNNVNSNFQIKGLNPGVYSYKASTEIDGEARNLEGEFSIRKMELESLISRADFDILRKVAARNDGIFVNSLNEDEINRILGENNSGIIHSREVNLDTISLFWLFFAGLALISAEWFIRKFSGAY